MDDMFDDDIMLGGNAVWVSITTAYCPISKLTEAHLELPGDRCEGHTSWHKCRQAGT